jgi:hypothetical protein
MHHQNRMSYAGYYEDFRALRGEGIKAPTQFLKC